MSSVIQTVSRVFAPQGSRVTKSPVPGLLPVVSAITKLHPRQHFLDVCCHPRVEPWTGSVFRVCPHVGQREASRGRCSGQVPCWCVDPCISASVSPKSPGQPITCAYTLTQMLTHPPKSGIQSFMSSVPRQCSEPSLPSDRA